MENKPRKPWVAALLSLLMPGLGQIYNGQMHKGLLYMIVPFFFFPALILIMDSAYFLYLLGLGVALSLLYFVYVLVDAIRAAKKNKEDYYTKKYNNIAVYAGIFIIALLCTLYQDSVLKANYLRSYQAPSSSMATTILKGDHFLADMRPSARTPERGDIIIFQYPPQPEIDFVKRVIATQDDVVRMQDKQLYVDNKAVQEDYIRHSDPNIVTDGKGALRDNFGPIIVPQNAYFVLGDNRDQSYDSRFWGPVDSSLIRGRAKIIYFSWDSENNRVRWDRIGMKLSE